MASSSINPFKKTVVHPIRHTTLTLPVKWSAFTHAFEAKLHRINLSESRDFSQFSDYEKAIEKNNAGEPFTIFNVIDHGRLATIRSQSTGNSGSVHAKRYEFGNGLFASSMTIHDARAGQYAPLTMLCWEGEGQTVCQYDSAEDLIGKGTLDNPEVVKVAQMLDREREKVIMEAFETAKEQGGKM